MQDIFLERITLYNFKNYEEAELKFSSPVVCLLGNNGSGKTNILDAIYYLCFTRSFFNPADSQNIAEGHDQCSINGEFLRGEMPEVIHCAIRKNQKKILKRNFKEYDKLADHIGHLPCVIVTPYDIELIWEGSEERRRFIDTTISQYSREYLDHLMHYNHAMNQRNNLLKSFGSGTPFHPEVLEAWDFQLAERGQKIHEIRERFMEEFIPLVQAIYEKISSAREVPTLEYCSDLRNESLSSLLSRNREKDRVLERTTAGPHKDDLEFKLNDRSLKKFASQGQQKSFLFALKLAQFEIIRKNIRLNPILMLDDLFDKVDESRVRQILHWLLENEIGQVFITDTHPTRIPELLKSMDFGHQVYAVEDGKIHQPEMAI